MARQRGLIAAFVVFDLAVGAVIVAPLVGLPETAHVERSALIDRSPCELQALLARPSDFAAWSPWADAQLTVTSSEPCAKVTATLEHPGPYAATFAIAPNGDGSHLTWSIDKSAGNNPVARVFGAMLEGQLGPDLEAGLVRLKPVAAAPIE